MKDRNREKEVKEVRRRRHESRGNGLQLKLVRMLQAKPALKQLLMRPEQLGNRAQQQGNGVSPQEDASYGSMNANNAHSYSVYLRIPSTPLPSEAGQQSTILPSEAHQELDERRSLETPMPLLQPSTRQPETMVECLQPTPVYHSVNQQAERQQCPEPSDVILRNSEEYKSREQISRCEPNGMQQQPLI
uniref:Uncharacterized protein n=1 Tax=Plectus sambesii TaxID=2011161 RepID=A0A914UIE9_9BILA